MTVAGQLRQLEEASPASKDRITDLTSLEEIGFGFPEVMALAKERGRFVFASPVKSALVANRPLQVGYARMFEMLNDNPRIEVRVVESMEDATRWFAESPGRAQ